MQLLEKSLTDFLGSDPITYIRCHTGFTEKEAEIAILLLGDFDLHEIGEKLSISYKTVRTHVHNIRNKLDISGSGRGRLRREISAAIIGQKPDMKSPFAILIHLN